jgi:membrane-bound metal-dependent hydrolase YbcI (DUF457 family)
MGPPGHFGIALAVKPAAPKVTLWVLLVSSELLDLLWMVFLFTGIESTGISQTTLQQGMQEVTLPSIPWSHGLFMALVWSLLAGSLAYFWFKDRRTAGIIAGVVFSHWILDFIVHPPDLPLLFNNSPRVGLGLWATGSGFILSVVLEIVLFTGGLTVYLLNRKNKLRLMDPNHQKRIE